ncbi:MAG TPA: hypothetical protein VMP67_09340 [Candidatus Limnocylindria bacterium]|nr:hypothetical protein [Candidatus Limnocylindria bacterium]
MGAVAHIETRALTVTPGAEAVAEIRVRNTGTVVDQFTLDVLGDAQPWATAEPATLSLFPGAEEKARIVFRPPRSSEVPAGPLPFAVRVQSREDPAGSVVEEGLLHVEPFSDVFAELAPRTSRGSRGAAHDLAVDNRGNAALNASITAIDPDRLLEFDVQPPAVLADPGTAAFARVLVKPRQRFWRGAPQTRPFRVQLETAGGPPVGVDGTMLQEAILPPWFLKALMAVLGLLVLAVLFWLFFLQPTIESSAREQAEEILAQHGLTPIPQQPGTGTGTGTSGPTPPTGPTATPAPGATPPPTPAPTLPGGAQPRGERILVGGALSPDAGRTLFVTDLIFSNPSDDATGEVELRLGAQTLLALRLQNFRDLDFHFVTPIVVGDGQQLMLVCTVPECPGTAVYISGYQR